MKTDTTKQRILKFRARQLNGGEWVFGYYLVDANGRHCIGTRDNCYEVVPDTVGQFTGLLDNNGKEIYEGDIVEAGKRRTAKMIVWHERIAAFVATSNNIEVEYGVLSLQNDMEVIGNIYENKDLLGTNE